ncbi:MAG: hypothetical protein AAF750_07535 [Planctomycetota bacterium]
MSVASAIGVGLRAAASLHTTHRSVARRRWLTPSAPTARPSIMWIGKERMAGDPPNPTRPGFNP